MMVWAPRGPIVATGASVHGADWQSKQAPSFRLSPQRADRLLSFRNSSFFFFNSLRGSFCHMFLLMRKGATCVLIIWFIPEEVSCNIKTLHSAFQKYTHLLKSFPHYNQKRQRILLECFCVYNRPTQYSVKLWSGREIMDGFQKYFTITNLKSILPCHCGSKHSQKHDYPTAMGQSGDLEVQADV